MYLKCYENYNFHKPYFKILIFARKFLKNDLRIYYKYIILINDL